MANQDIGEARNICHSIGHDPCGPCDKILNNKLQRAAINEVLERGFGSLEALSLLNPEAIKSQKIPVRATMVAPLHQLPNHLAHTVREMQRRSGQRLAPTSKLVGQVRHK